MTIEQAHEIFDDYGYAALFETIRYPIMLSGELDDADSDMLEHFFDVYSLEAVEDVVEFICYFRTFKIFWVKMYREEQSTTAAWNLPW
jgi:hypothetical protein